MLQSGRVAQFAFLVGACAFLIFLLWLRKKKEFTPKIRKLAALDAIEQVVGRATEMGRPIHVSPGTPSATEGIEAETVVGLAMTSYVSRLCAKYGARPIATASRPELLPIMQEIIKESYAAEGKTDAYRDEDVIYISGEGNAYVAGVQGIVEREKCVGNIIIGRMYGSSFMLFARASVAGNVMQIGGTAYYLNVPHLMATCDYVLVGEELFAAEAYVSQEPKQLLAVFTQDIFKVLSLVLLGLGVLLYIAGNSTIINMLRM